MKLEKKLVFIFNPKAGKGKIKTSLMDIVDIFNKGGYEVIIRATQAPKDAYEQVKKYADKVDLIVCSGGDGTLDEVVTGITKAGCGIYDHEGRDLQMRCRQIQQPDLCLCSCFWSFYRCVL